MRKGFLCGVYVLLVIIAFLPSGCGQAESIKIGINAPLTGDIPKVGEGTKFAAQIGNRSPVTGCTTLWRM